MDGLTTKNTNLELTINRYHLFFERNKYKNALQMAFRNFVGLVITVRIIAHHVLHALLKPPLKPNDEMMVGCIERLSAIDRARAKTDPFYGLTAAAEFFINYAERVPSRELATRAERICRHLGMQADILNTMEMVNKD